MKIKIFFAMIMVLIVSFSFASGEFSYKNNRLQTNYFAGENIVGSINISFVNQPANSMFTSNLGGNITLKELLDKNNITPSCSTSNCLPDYVALDEISSFNLQNGSKLVGFKINTNDINSVSSLKFKISSNLADVCYDSILVDVLNKNEKFVQNVEYSSQNCPAKSTGCFNSSLSSNVYSNPLIGLNRYCERVTLLRAPGYEIGAKITKVSNAPAESELKMELFNIGGSLIGECSLPAVSENNQEVGCIINHSVNTQKQAIACIKSINDLERYSIRAEQTGAVCGNSNKDSTNYNVDYEIYSKSLQFSGADTLVNSQNYELNNGGSLISYINSYVDSKYGESCPEDGCIIPFKIMGSAQDLTFSDVELKYSSSIGTISNNDLYTLGSSEAKINSGVLSLKLDSAKFLIPSNSSPSSFRLYLNGDQVMSQNINISSSFDFSVSPNIVLLGVDTGFLISSSQNISFSRWEFGNGDVKNVSGKLINYKYSKPGEYTLSVTATSLTGKSSKKSFFVSVGNANESAKKLLDIYSLQVSNLSKKINSYPPWVSAELNKKYDLITYNATLGRVRAAILIADEDQDYIDAVAELMTIDLPKEIYVSRSGTLPLIYGADNMNIDYLKKISGEEGSNSNNEKIKNDILSWMVNNYASSITFETISSFDSNNVEKDILTKVKINLVPKNQDVPRSFLIIDYPMSAIKFSGSSDAKSVDSGTYIPVQGSQDIEFLIAEDIRLEELGIYLSPEISQLGGSYEDLPFIERREFRTLWFIIFILILIILTLTGYIALQEWYKKNYEKHLFRNKDDLYNLINFIYNSRTSNLKNSEIRKNLSKNKWSSEQITYAFRKIDGKRTGMWEIPLFKGKENREVHEEIAKRHGGSIDTRFIKRPEF